MFFCENSSCSLRGIVPRIERPSCHSVKRHCAFILVLQSILYATLNSFTRDYCLLLRLHNASRRLLCLQTAKLILLRPRDFQSSPLTRSCYPVRTLIDLVSRSVHAAMLSAYVCANGAIATEMFTFLNATFRKVVTGFYSETHYIQPQGHSCECDSYFVEPATMCFRIVLTLRLHVSQ